MAQPPKPPTSAERRAEANAAAGAAERKATARQAQESRKQADRLLRGAADARFDALSDEDPHLLAADRRRILLSLAGREPPRRIVSGGTASRWTLIRSRLSYRKSVLTAYGLVAVMVIAAYVVARSNTPIGTVVSNYGEPRLVDFKLKDGQVAFSTLEPTKRYALMSQGNDMAVLRQWVPGVGYAEARVPVADVGFPQQQASP